MPISSDKTCLRHHCTDCGTDLKPVNAWVAFILLAVVFVGMLSILHVVEKYEPDTSELEARLEVTPSCRLLVEVAGKDNASGRDAVKRQFTACKDFVPN